MPIKSRLLRSTLLAGAALALVIPQAAGAQEKVRWQIPMSFASTLTALGDTMPWVADQLRAVSGGNIDLQIAEPGTVVPPLSIFENVSTGAIDAGYSWMGYEIGQVPASALFGATPFGLESTGFLAWMNFHGGKELLEETFEPYNVHPISCGTISPEAAGWFKNEIKSVDDLKGLKFRAAGLGGEIMSEFGMSVTLLPGGELYQALETGVLDATEFSLPTVDEQLGFYQVAKNYYLPGWHQPSTNQFLYVNLDIWNGLAPETQATIEMACMAGNAMAIAKAEALQGAVLKKFADEGVQVRTYDDEALKAFYAATKTVMERKSAEDPQFAKVYESMITFQKELAPWDDKGYLPRDWLEKNAFTQ